MPFLTRPGTSSSMPPLVAGVLLLLARARLEIRVILHSRVDSPT